MAGSAIGLGNIWRFPYIVGEYGGAAFILIYILSTLIVSLPVFVAEVTVGRRSRKSAYGAMHSLRPGHKVWKFAGFLAVFTPLIINSYYSVIGGWSLDYFLRACTGQFVSVEPSAASGIFGEFISSVWGPIACHLVFLGICALVVLFGVKSGIEKFSKITIPTLFFLIIAMIVYSVSLPGAMDGVRYLLKPDFSQITPRSFAFALGQSFYSLSLGMGAIITYGSYVSKKEDIVLSGAGTAVSDLLFAILAGFAVMPAVFAAGIAPGAGTGLIFQSIPYVFSSLGQEVPWLSTLFSVIFFLSILMAALTSCISLFEVGVSFLIDRSRWSRPKATLAVFLACGLLGVVCSLSFGPLADIQISGKAIFDLLDWFSSNILLLLLAFLTMIFVGFALPRQDVYDEITNGGTRPVNVKLFGFIYFLIKWVAPVFIAIIFVTNFIL